MMKMLDFSQRNVASSAIDLYAPVKEIQWLFRTESMTTMFIIIRQDTTLWESNSFMADSQIMAGDVR